MKKLIAFLFLLVPPFGWLVAVDWFICDGSTFPHTIKSLKDDLTP